MKLFGIPHPVQNPRLLHSPSERKRRSDHGFTLVMTLMLLTLVIVVSLGLLSLSQQSMRTGTAESARREATANARLALMLALNEIQEQLGDDRRITADAAIFGKDLSQPHLVGVWNSMAGNQLINPLAPPPDYQTSKIRDFRKWLTSSPDRRTLQDRDYAKTPLSGKAPYLFSKDADGFDMRAPLVNLTSASQTQPEHGAFAWAVTQAATRASLNITGATQRQHPNDRIEAPDRPGLALSTLIKQPQDGWQERAGKVITMSQVVLDRNYGLPRARAGQVNEHYNLISHGLQTDVVNGGLKTDLSLGFEMNDSDFAASHWGKIKNPFFPADEWKLGFKDATATPEKVLYQSISSNVDGTKLQMKVNYGPISFNFNLDSGISPTLNSLRSHYRLRHHVYQTQAAANGNQGITAFQRFQNSPAYFNYGAPNGSPARGSETGLNPVIDRILLYLSPWVDGAGELYVVMTPVVTIWNPYNVALETDGLLVYPWMDFPVFINWTINGKNPFGSDQSLSTLLGHGRKGEGRQTEPYFLFMLTADGTSQLQNNIHLEPGEVRAFVPSSPSPVYFNRKWNGNPPSLMMKPVSITDDLKNLNTGGLYVIMRNSTDGKAGVTQPVMPDDDVLTYFKNTRNQHFYNLNVEGSARIRNPSLNFDNIDIDQTKRSPLLAEIHIAQNLTSMLGFSGTPVKGALLRSAPQPMAVLETYHRTAAQSGQLSDIAYTINPRQRYIAGMLSGSSSFAAGPHYESRLVAVSDFISSVFQVTPDGRRCFYGISNAPSTGSDYLTFFEVPTEPMLSLASFQHADLTDTAFSPGYQVANSWASPYLERSTAARLLKGPSSGNGIFSGTLGLYDHSYLLNTALWDTYFFSSVAPETSFGSNAGAAAYDSPQSSVTKSTKSVLQGWIENPTGNPLRNPRHLFHQGSLTKDELLQLLASPQGCREIAAHLLVEGSFNVNSTDEEAWAAMLSSLRGSELHVTNGPDGSETTRHFTEQSPFPRMKNPLVREGDQWNRIRSLTDDDIRKLAREIVDEVRSRGPFQSLAEFVNRRLTEDSQGLAGTLQAAIDRVGLNNDEKIASFNTSGYPYPNNIPDPSTGVGTPGWLTQADLLTGLGPFLSVRSDTLIIRAYGESRDANGKVHARCLLEATVQRVPEWVNPQNEASTPPSDLTPVNARFGRRFEIISLHEIPLREGNG